MLTGFGAFEEVPPGIPAFEEKWRAIVVHGLPWLVAERDGQAIGYAYASPFRPRTGYRYSVEDSVYVRDDDGTAKVLAFIIPETVSETAQPAEFTVTVDEIERKTNLDFMPELPSGEQERIETQEAAMW